MDTSHDASPLGLPAAIRRVIYEKISIVKNAKDGRVDLTRRFKYWPNAWSQNLHNLLLVCTTIYAELAPLIYSSNQFYVRYDWRRGEIRGLRELTGTAISSLRHLSIVLNVEPYPEPDQLVDCEYRVPPHRRCCNPLWMPDPPVNPPDYKRLLLEWESVAEYIAPYILPGRLQLFFICDTEDISTAKSVVNPILRFFPRLDDCSISLSLKPNRALQNMARAAVLRMTNDDTFQPIKSAFRFMNLPAELRLLVLQHTDLIVPFGEISWNSTTGFFLYHDKWCYSDGPLGPPCPLQKWHYLNERREHEGCFCRQYHGAFSKRCNCPGPPTPSFPRQSGLSRRSTVCFLV